ncbi:uncharacterized protein RAG0_07361 [Rhynchosporium agropyri]|uniref:Uncharacterized protein n=1 Tax=Rhynchosporium agropyri TaxID=914238 RepID=A0A1E1KLB1_9HELO|nr:uncharacterized protein RAG0_07361 [Rhynchosporium agropyri]
MEYVTSIRQRSDNYSMYGVRRLLEPFLGALYSDLTSFWPMPLVKPGHTTTQSSTKYVHTGSDPQLRVTRGGRTKSPARVILDPPFSSSKHTYILSHSITEASDPEIHPHLSLRFNISNMKLTLISALFISGALSAAISDAGLEARVAGFIKQCFCSVSGLLPSERNLFLIITYRPVNDHNGFQIYEYMPLGSGYIQRNAPVYDAWGYLQGYCNIGFERKDDCTKWYQSTTTTGGPCDGKIHPADCTEVCTYVREGGTYHTGDCKAAS